MMAVVVVQEMEEVGDRVSPGLSEPTTCLHTHTNGPHHTAGYTHLS